MKTTIGFAALLAAASAAAQSPSSAFDRGNGLQAWQHPDVASVLERCVVRPPSFSLSGGAQASTAPPPPPALPTVTAIPGVIAAGETWRVVWAWEGNNADGPIAGDGDKLLFANNDASNVMEIDLTNGLARVVHDDVNTGGAVSRSKNGALFVLARGLGGGVLQLEPERKMLANTYNGEPFECIGGVPNDLSVDARGGVYFTVTGAGLFYASPQGVVTRFGGELPGANGVILSPDERTLYVTNGPVVVAFDVQRDGSLTNQREFAKLRSGGGDGSVVDAEGRLYVATGSAAEVFAPDGKYLGTIPGPQGLHGVTIGGRDKKTLVGIVFYGGWGTPSARNQVVTIPLLAQGYTGRAK